MSEDTKKTVVVGMSGGVDSSVTAALLQEQGYNVIGVFMYNWDDKKMGTADINGCPQEKDQSDVRRVCGKLKIPFYTFDFTKEYKNRVFKYFIEEYEAGRTPNPDMLCNKEIKFSVFLDKAKKLGADLVATGHYAQLILKGTKKHLARGVDGNKDQSYFLADVEQSKFTDVIFPLGDLEKGEVRKLAKKFKLPVAEKKDSQGICFIGDIEVATFLRRFIRGKKGNVVTEEGEKIGTHDGAMYYTVGQRHGLGIAADLPYYVTRTDIKSNTIYVAKGNKHPALFSNELVIAKMNWFCKPAKFPTKVLTQVRYRQKAQAALLSRQGKKYKLKFPQKQRAITPGQFAVIYKDDLVLGSGIIC